MHTLAWPGRTTKDHIRLVHPCMHTIVSPCNLGAKEKEQIYEAFEKIYPVLGQFRKGDVPAPNPALAQSSQAATLVRCYHFIRLSLSASCACCSCLLLTWSNVSCVLQPVSASYGSQGPCKAVLAINKCVCEWMHC